MFFVQNEKNDIRITRRVGGKKGKEETVESMEFTVMGKTENIDNGKEEERILLLDFWLNLTILCESAGVVYKEHIFDKDSHLHVDMFVKYEESDPYNADVYNEYIKANECNLMEFLLKCLDMGIVKKENIVSREVSKIYDKGTGGVFVSIKQIDTS